LVREVYVDIRCPKDLIFGDDHGDSLVGERN